MPSGHPDVNLDGWLAHGSTSQPALLHLAVVDGASVRISLGDTEPAPTGRAFTDLVVRALCDAAERPQRADPAGHLRLANAVARRALGRASVYRAVFGLLNERPRPLGPALRTLPRDIGETIEASFTAVLKIDELDTRYLRLCLPACVATVAVIDLATSLVRFAHAGDTVLVRARGGSVDRLTDDQMGRFDAEVIEIGERLAAAGYRGSMVAAASDPAVVTRDILNGVRHNYVDEHGRPSRYQGCGVIDGLRQLSAYIQQGEFKLGSDETLALLSDGMAMPLSAPRRQATPLIDSIARWKRALAAGDAVDLGSQLESVRSADMESTAYPRLKVRDDATAVLLRSVA